MDVLAEHAYIGTKIVLAEPMNRADYNQFRGWELPADEDGADLGYIIEYTDGYISWSPVEQFDDAYTPTTAMTFGLAIDAMRKGFKVAREGWNGKNMFIFWVPGSTFQVNRAPLLGIFEEGTEITYQSHIDMYTADGTVVPWLASQSDIAALDWTIV